MSMSMPMTPLDGEVVAKRDRQFVEALAKGLDILRCFDRPGREITVSQIARQVGLSQPRAWRLCYTLLECGYLVRGTGTSGLRVGAPALTLGYAAIRGMDLPGLAEPHMRQLTDHQGLTTTLTLCHAAEMVSVHQTDGEFVPANQPIGWRASMTSTSSGLAVLTVMDDRARQAAMRTIQERDPQAWTRRMARIEAADTQFAEHGYVTFDGSAGGQYSAVAVALVEPGAGVADGAHRYWAISCGGVRALFDPDLFETVGRELVAVRSLLQPALEAISQ